MHMRISSALRARIEEMIETAADDGWITPLQQKTLYGCVNAGDGTGAMLGLARLMRRKNAEDEEANEA